MVLLRDTPKWLGWWGGDHVDGILILADASCGNFPERVQKKKCKVKRPFLSHRGDLTCLPLKMARFFFFSSAPRHLETNSRRTDSRPRVVPSVLAVPDTTRLCTFCVCVVQKNQKETRKGRCSRWYMERSRGVNTHFWLALWEMPERFVRQCLPRRRTDLLHFKMICSFPFSPPTPSSV